MKTTRGVVLIHSAPSAMCRHVEWALGGVTGAPLDLDWTPQPAERAAYRAELSWSGAVGMGARLASALRGWPQLRFEVTEEPAAGCEGERWAYTPTLGVFHATLGLHGDVYVHEDRLKKAIVDDALGLRLLPDSLADLLGTRWDDELETFRQAGEGVQVRWLHQVV
ncbi:MAG: DUF3145 domain-containing protein [Propionibacteriaceae bacterium]|nr:DUF3145 domain-containing protein [Micropruina sp.]HBX80896.1 DUF3145 domain-containing protein [Propionibacteriaceae bacterium]HBY23561.1 DUF3145 domain-containing protein [Propionibacteriaceae bacterium]